MIQRRKYLKRSTKPIARFSPRKAAANRLYGKTKKAYMDAHFFCEYRDCCRPATDLHHKARRGPNLCRPETFMALCRFHHDKIHQNPGWARKNGYIA